MDLVTATLMVFVLVGFVRTVLSVEDMEALITRRQQEVFLRAFTTEFASEIEAGTVGVARRLNFVQITFSDQVLFRPYEHEIEATGKALLARCARTLEDIRSESSYELIQVEGHTDSRDFSRPEYPHDNWELSTARSLNVVRFLARQGLPRRVFSANGYAENRPVALNSSSEGRARNRRIEVRVFFSVNARRAQ